MWTASSPIASGLRALLAIAIVRSGSSGGCAAATTQALATWSTGTMSIRFAAVPGQVGEAAGRVGEDQRVGDLDPLEPARPRLLQGGLDDRRPHDRRPRAAPVGQQPFAERLAERVGVGPALGQRPPPARRARGVRAASARAAPRPARRRRGPSRIEASRCAPPWRSARPRLGPRLLLGGRAPLARFGQHPLGVEAGDRVVGEAVLGDRAAAGGRRRRRSRRGRSGGCEPALARCASRRAGPKELSARASSSGSSKETVAAQWMTMSIPAQAASPAPQGARRRGRRRAPRPAARRGPGEVGRRRLGDQHLLASRRAAASSVGAGPQQDDERARSPSPWRSSAASTALPRNPEAPVSRIALAGEPVPHPLVPFPGHRRDSRRVPGAGVPLREPPRARYCVDGRRRIGRNGRLNTIFRNGAPNATATTQVAYLEVEKDPGPPRGPGGRARRRRGRRRRPGPSTSTTRRRRSPACSRSRRAAPRRSTPPTAA